MHDAFMLAVLSECKLFGNDDDQSVCSLPTFNYGGMAAAALPSTLESGISPMRVYQAEEL